jgi:Protein of unknown function (DUF3716)
MAILIAVENDRTRNVVPQNLIDVVEIGAGQDTDNWPTREIRWRRDTIWGPMGENVSFVPDQRSFHQYHIGAVFGQAARGAEPKDACNCCQKHLVRPFVICATSSVSVGAARSRLQWNGACTNCRFQARAAPTRGGSRGTCSLYSETLGRCTPDFSGTDFSGSGVYVPSP